MRTENKYHNFLKNTGYIFIKIAQNIYSNGLQILSKNLFHRVTDKSVTKNLVEERVQRMAKWIAYSAGVPIVAGSIPLQLATFLLSCIS